MKSLLMIAALLLSAVAMAAPEKYQGACSTCHAAGIANAPRTHDVEAWKPRLAKGMEALLNSVKNGYKAMPPKGLCNDCTDAEYKALIEFMSSAG